MTSIDLRTVAIQPLRNTFDHIVERFGDKPASRYQEGSYRVQAEGNFHYRPTWAPQYEIFDPSRTALVMADWYSFKDPRQFYYGTYTLARAKMEENAEGAFTFVEQRGLAASFDADARATALAVLMPLRHVAWGSNTNNAAMCAYGYGTTFTQPCLYHGMDQLGIAQYLTRVGLMLGGTDALAAGKQAWVEADAWQPLRRLVEDMMVVSDPIELYIAQNLALDGLLYPLVYRDIDTAITVKAGPTVSMLLQFQTEWFTETTKWIDATVKTMTGESAANAELVSGWFATWAARAAEALEPVAALALPDAAAAVAAVRSDLAARAAGLGITTNVSA